MSNPQPFSKEEQAELDALEAKANEESEKLLEGEETPAEESAPKESKTPEKEETEEPETPSAGEEEESEEDELTIEPNSSRKAQKRFKQLAKKASRAEELEKENEDLKRKLGISSESKSTPVAPLDLFETPVQKKKGPVLPWHNEEDNAEDTKMSPEDVQRIVAETVNKKAAVGEWLQNLSSDRVSIEQKYPQLNPEHESFNPALAAKLSSLYDGLAFERDPQNQARVVRIKRPDLRLSTFVEEFMGLLDQSREDGRRTVTTNVLKQASRQAISPSGTPSKNRNVLDQIKDPNTSLEEAEKLANQGAKS